MNAADVISQRIAANDHYGALQEIDRLESLPRKCLEPDEQMLLLFEAGRVRLHLGDYHRAEESLREFVALVGPTGRGAASALVNLGLATLHQNRPGEAVHQFRRAAAADPPETLRPTVQYGLTWALLEAGEMAEASRQIVELRRISRTRSQLLDADLCEGFERLLSGDLAGAHLAAEHVVTDSDSDQRQRTYAFWLLAEVGAAAGEVEAGRVMHRLAVSMASVPPRPWLLNRLQSVRVRLDKERGVS